VRRARAQIVKKGDPDTGAAGGKRRRNALSDLRREVAIMRTLRHRNIVTLQARPVARGRNAVIVAGGARSAPGHRRSAPAGLNAAAPMRQAAGGGRDGCGETEWRSFVLAAAPCWSGAGSA
jgi:hypothetical protein